MALDGSLTPNYYCRPHMSPSKVPPPESAPLDVKRVKCSHGVPHTLTGTQHGDTARRSQAHLVSHGTVRTDAPPKRTTLINPPKVVHQSHSKGLARLGAKQGMEGNLLPATLSQTHTAPSPLLTVHVC